MSDGWVRREDRMCQILDKYNYFYGSKQFKTHRVRLYVNLARNHAFFSSLLASVSQFHMHHTGTSSTVIVLLYSYFRKENLYGLACFENMKVESEIERGARMKSVGILSTSYTSLYKHMQFLETQVR